jgi:hypothetical protein
MLLISTSKFQLGAPLVGPTQETLAPRARVTLWATAVAMVMWLGVRGCNGVVAARCFVRQAERPAARNINLSPIRDWRTADQVSRLDGVMVKWLARQKHEPNLSASPPIATELMRRSEMTRCAKKRHQRRDLQRCSHGERSGIFA